jgi:hypothetical protein
MSACGEYQREQGQRRAARGEDMDRESADKLETRHLSLLGIALY